LVKAAAKDDWSPTKMADGLAVKLEITQEGLFFKQEAALPPFEPLQFHVQVVAPLTLFALVPVVHV
jgi:hypothetical protein